MKEHGIFDSIQLTRIHAVQWYGFCDSFDLAGQTIITGVYGCGKTGIIDLIQTVLLGHPDRESRYNLSLAEIGSSGREDKRNLRGYCLQDLNLKDHGHPVYARDNSRTYIALEFTWPNNKRRETWGLRVEYTSVGADADIAYWKIPARVEFNDFLGDDKVPLSADEWEQFLYKYKVRVFPSKEEYLESICAAQHLNFNARVFKPLLLQTLQFKFGKDFTEFCRNNMLPDDPIDLEVVRESYDRYRSFVSRIHLLQEQESVLQKIQDAFFEQKKTRDEVAALEWFQKDNELNEAKSVWHAAEVNWKALRDAAETWQRQNDELEQVKTNAEQHLKAGHDLRRATPNAEEFDGLKKREQALPAEIEQLRKTLDDPVGEFIAKFARFHELWRLGKTALRDFNWPEPPEFQDLSEELPDQINADVLGKLTGELLSVVDPLVTHFNGLAQAAEAQLRLLENDESNLRRELSRLDQSLTAEALPLHTELIANFGPTEVHLLGSLCTILDDDWTNALEINFSHKFASIVPGPKIKEAFAVLHALPRPDRRERLLCREDMATLSASVQPGSLAEKITSSDPAVGQLLAHLFGDVICCQTIEETEAYPQAVLPNGSIKLPTGRRRRQAEASEYVIGESGRLRMIERKQKELEDVETAKTEATRHVAASKTPAQGFQSIKTGLLQLSTSKIQQLRKLESKLSEQSDIHDRLDLFENAEQLEKLHKDIASRAEAATKAAEAIRDHLRIQPADASEAQRQAASAKEVIDRRELVWLKWQDDHPDKIKAASRHLDLKEEIERETSSARSASTVCELIIGRRKTVVAETQSNLRISRLSLKQDARFPDYRDIDELDFDDNSYFDKKLTFIGETGIKEMRAKAEQAELEWEDRFQNQVLGLLQTRLSEIRETFSGLRRITAGRQIGGAKYDFTFESVKRADMDRLRQLAADREADNLLPADDKRLEEIKKERRAAMETLTLPSDQKDMKRVQTANARIRELLDARCYFTYDMDITEAGRTESISLSQRGRKGSGGETYNPYFIALTTAYLRAFQRHINTGRPSISLLLMDEAFKVLNSEAIRDCVQIIRELGLQGVISCTDTNGGQAVEFFQWAMIVQKRVSPGAGPDGHDMIENTIVSAHSNDPEIASILDDVTPDAAA